MRLTDIAVRSLRPPERGQRIYFDDTLRSFGCRVSQGGTRSFVLQCGDDRRLITIGRYGVITLSEARQEAKRILAERTLGKLRPRTVPWDGAVKEYLAHCQQTVRPRTHESYTRLLHKHFAFGTRRLSELTYEDIIGKLDRLDHAPAERNHALVAVKAFLSWAQRPPRRYLQHNPCEGLTPTHRPARKRRLNQSELAAVYRAALASSEPYASIAALLILLGQRSGETSALRWEWIDEKARTITIPGPATKNGRDHTVPYTEAAAMIFKRLPRLGPYLFPATREHVRGKPCTTFRDWNKSKTRFDKVCGVSGWTNHDLRRTFATGLAELGVLPHVIERILNHSLGTISNRTDGTISAVAEVYNLADYLPDMREALAKWEARLSELLHSP